MVTQENERNKANIKKLEDDITQFTQDMRKRETMEVTLKSLEFLI